MVTSEVTTSTPGLGVAGRSKSEGKEAYLAYVAEGLGKFQKWEEVMKWQRKNGSLFNSPSTTAAALTHLHDAKCLTYLSSVLEKFGNAVPTTYPLDMCTHLGMVDFLETLGIARHFRTEIENVLDEAVRCWHQGDEEMLLDAATCAKAFRLLRMHGYELSSDTLAKFSEEPLFNSLEGQRSSISTVLEVYLASLVMVFPNELVLEKLNSWSSQFSKGELLKLKNSSENLPQESIHEVDYALKFPGHANLPRLEH